MTSFLGVDGGGTSTVLCLVSDHGDVLARAETRSCYYLGSVAADVGLVSEVLGEAVPAVCDRAGITSAEVGFAFFGLPAYGEVSADLPELDAAPHAALGHERYRCDNDMVCGWAGSLGLEDGINVISGTGSMAYGRHGDRRARVGGWGEAFGDEGSGYWVGLRGLQAFSQMSDGRLPTGPLLGLLRAHLELDTDLDLVDVVLNRWRGGRREIAALSRPVVAAADLGDAVARQVLVEAAGELARLVEAARVRLEFAPDALVPVSYSGGMFSVPGIRDGFEQRLAEAGINFSFRAPRYSPAVGAALYAARLAGSPLTADALLRLSVSST